MHCLMKRYITATFLLLTVVLQTTAQALTDRYTRQRPLVITCHWDTPPYEFLNDDGLPAGINVDIIGHVMKKLDIPCIFIMKDWGIAKNIFETGEADLILSDDRSFHNTSYCVSEEVLNYQRSQDGAVSEVHFISRDRQLIDQIDDQYQRMKQNGELAIIQDHWQKPGQRQTDSTSMILSIAGAILLFTVILYLFDFLSKRYVEKVTRYTIDLNGMITKALHMGNYDVMVYEIAKNHFYNQYGTILPKEGCPLEEYVQRIHPDQREEFTHKLKNLIEGRERHFELNKRWNKGTELSPHYLNFQGHAICELDNNGQPAYIINAVNDVTREMQIYEATRDIEHRYEAILNDPFIAMSFYDSRGILIDHNEAMKNLLHGIDSSLFKEISRPQDREDMRVTRHLYYPEYGIDKYIECHIKALYNAKGEVANFLVTTNEQKVTS